MRVAELLTGLRIGFSVCFLGTLISELFGSQRGLGYLVINSVNMNDVSLTTSVVTLIVVFAVASNALLTALSR